MAERTVKLILSTIDDVKESDLNPTLKVWRILPTLYTAREREDQQTLEELTAQHRVLPTSPRESRFSIAYSHPYERHPMTWRQS